MTQLLEKERKLYSILGLDDGASIDEVRKAYRQRALECHPDKKPGDEEAAEYFKLINHANQVLTDERRKKEYDRYANTEAVRFAQKAYQDSHYRDVDEARKQREQDLYKRRAQREAPRMGEGKRYSTPMQESQKDFWEKKDRERNKNLAAKMNQERERAMHDELERKRERELAKERAQEGRRREAERRRRLESEKERDEERKMTTEIRKREKVDQERQKQDEARRRELERQIVKRQRQAEKMKADRARQDEQDFSDRLAQDRTDLAASETEQRKRLGVEQVRAKKELVEHLRTGSVTIRNRLDCLSLEDDEDAARAETAQEQLAVHALVALQITEWHASLHISDEEVILRSSLARVLAAGVRHWEAAYAARRALEAQHRGGAAGVAAAAAAEQQQLDLLSRELAFRGDLTASEATGAQYIHTKKRVAAHQIASRVGLAAAEQAGRGVVRCEEERLRRSQLALTVELLALLRVEANSRRQIEIAAAQAAEASDEAAALQRARREAAERAQQAEFERKLKVEALGREVERLRARDEESTRLLAASAAALDDARLEANLARAAAEALEAENRALKQEIRGFNSAAASVAEASAAAEQVQRPPCGDSVEPPQLSLPTTPAAAEKRKRSSSARASAGGGGTPSGGKRAGSKVAKRRSSYQPGAKSPKEVKGTAFGRESSKSPATTRRDDAHHGASGAHHHHGHFSTAPVSPAASRSSYSSATPTLGRVRSAHYLGVPDKHADPPTVRQF